MAASIAVPNHRWRSRSQGEEMILSASNPIVMITDMMLITWL